jgi:hypothetical protein
MTNEEKIHLVQGQLEAYNKGDIDLFCSYYHDEIGVYRILNFNESLDFEKNANPVGISKFREIYEKLFKDFPQLHCKLKSRTVLNDCILDEEEVFKSNKESIIHAVAIYKFKDHKIFQVWFVR